MTCKRYPKLRHFCNSKHAKIKDIFIFTDSKSEQIIYNLLSEILLDSILNAWFEKKDHAIANSIRAIAMPKIACR